MSKCKGNEMPKIYYQNTTEENNTTAFESVTFYSFWIYQWLIIVTELSVRSEYIETKTELNKA